jgi:ABC-type Mn2+/Zn2+ transport system permease subunit
MAIILIAKNPLATARGLDVVSGNLLFTTSRDLVVLGIAAILIIVIHAAFFKEFIFISFDRETAFTTGIKANIKDLLLYSTIGVAISISMKICGVIFVFASLVIPAMTGLLVAKKIKNIFISAILIAACSVVVGIYISYRLDLPTAPAIVGIYGLSFVILSLVQLIRRQN